METTECGVPIGSVGVPEFGRRPGVSFSMPRCVHSMIVVPVGRTGRVTLAWSGPAVRPQAQGETMGAHWRATTFGVTRRRVKSGKAYGNPGIYGNAGNLESVSYRFYRG
jgi:hypothetical protein